MVIVYEFPENSLNLKNGTVIAPTKDMPWFGLKKGQTFPIRWDRKYVTAPVGGLIWDPEQLCGEIDKGFWKIVKL